jgi:hypothetical protein
MAILYAGVLPMLIGSMASAEERQMGTAEWQILLPMPAWQQWAMKAGVTLGLALSLGIVLPAALRYLSPAGHDFQMAARAWRETAAMAVVFTACGLYVSSLCTSGVRALVLTFPTIVAASLFIRTVESLIVVQNPWRYVSGRNIQFFYALEMVALYALGGGLVALLLWLAFRNHRSADRGAARTAKQGLAIAGYIATGVAVLELL